MDSNILIQQAKETSEKHLFNNDADRLAFRVGYLEGTIKQLCDLFSDAEKIMYEQRALIEKMKKVTSADL